jgi:hypothetical protein
MRSSRPGNPIPSLGGGFVRYKPLIPLTVIGPGGRWGPYVSVDTSADDVVFPRYVAPLLGIDLNNAPQLRAGGVGGKSAPVLYAPVILELTDSIDTYRWRSVVGFTSAFMKFPLFGIAGGLEFFRTTLDGFRKEVEILAQPNLPTTQDASP